MTVSWTSSLVLSALLLTTLSEAAVKPYITTSIDVTTECKTCPRSLCPNKTFYGYYGGIDGPLNVTCYTYGTKIIGDDLWLKTDAGCYVTQYDLNEYDGDYTEDLAYCGRASQEQHLTLEDATLKYKTECRICPELGCDTVAYLNEDTDLELTCWYPEGQVIIDDPYWHKTTNNCYVARKNLYSKPDITYLDNCGPIPLLEIAVHNNENGTSDVNKRTPLIERDDMHANYLVNVTVGEDYAPCRSCPSQTCEAEKMYEFNQEVWIQCVTDSGINGTADWYSLTTDFCYVHDTDFWESPEGDYYRMPLCEYFGDGKLPGDENR